MEFWRGTAHPPARNLCPRGTLHKRSTEDSVTFYLISPYGKMTA
jgi:hypothetical protein